MTPAACAPRSAGIPAWRPGPTPGRAGRRCTRPAPHGGTGSTRPGLRVCWPWPESCWTPEPTPTAAREGRAGTAAGRRCAARSPARPTRPSPGCCWSAAPCPATTTCTWRGSVRITTNACACSSTMPPMSLRSPGWRWPPRSAPTTPKEYGCCWRPGPTPTATPTTPTAGRAVYAAVRSGCSAELTGLLLAHGTDPDAPGPDWRSPYALATVQGRVDLATLLRRYGAADDIAGTDRFLAACQHADQAAGRAAADPRPRAARPPQRRAAGRSDGPRRQDRLHLRAYERSTSVSPLTPATATTEPRPCRPPPTPAMPPPSACCSTAVPISRHAMPPGIAPRSSGPPSAAGNGPPTIPPPTGSPPCRPCSRQAPRPRTSASHPMTPSRPAPKSRPSCVATANPHRTMAVVIDLAPSRRRKVQPASGRLRAGQDGTA